MATPKQWTEVLREGTIEVPSMDDELNDDGYTFQEWMRKADTVVSGHCGLSCDDLGDGPSWSSWHAGMSPKEYAEELLREEDFPF